MYHHRTPLVFAVATMAAGCTASADADGTISVADNAAELSEAAFAQESASVRQGEYWHYSFQKTAGWRYTICIDAIKGDADLFGHHTGDPTKDNWQFASEHLGTRSDCISFTASSAGTYYISVYGRAGTASFTLRRTSSDNAYVPDYLRGQLKRPNSCLTTIDWYGPFNSPWGNPVFDPFYNGHKNYIHNGVDYVCSAGTTVKAVCTGPVKAAGDLGSDVYNGATYWWGKYVVQECSINGQKVTIAYDHLNAAGLPVVGADLTKGQSVVGTIVDLTLTGEQDHLHLGICAGPHSSCGKLQRGASPDVSFPPALFINADAPSLWGP